MMSSTRVLLLLAASFICAYIVHADHYTLQFDCQPNGDIVIQNPDISYMRSATAGTNTTICNVTKTPDISSFTVSGCEKDTDILFTLSTRETDDATGDPIIGGNYYEAYIIHCTEISDEGVIFNQTFMFDIEANATGEGNDSMTNGTTHAAVYDEAPVTPSFTISSSIWNSNRTQKVTTANVGDLLKWNVHGPYEYDLLPYWCTVNPGTAVGNPPAVGVIENGCSVLDMVTNFVTASGNATERGSLVSDLYAFKFTMSNEITIACSVKICTRGDAACTVSCGGGGRRRRARNYREKDLAGTQATVVSHLTIEESGAVTLGLSHVLMTFACIIVLC
ncbi:uncharacterized protein LOC123526488 [Mercenaria mercenaria]|uniref:uncharacterized protein LOC123526488 n=1 Tax=Mercenaria mercenaria TaxID=6596 RepID=UPI00234E9AD8|nr:uncharacterized protein LOC123526488 [Mercenaria mercenaria]